MKEQLRPAPASDPCLVEERRRFLHLAFTGADLLFETDPTGRITHLHGAVDHILGLQTEQLVGGPLARILAAGNAKAVEAAFARIAAGGRTLLPTVSLRHASGALVRGSLRLFRLSQNAPCVYLTFALAAAPEEAQPPADAADDRLERFIDIVKARLKAHDGSGARHTLTLIEVPDFGPSEHGREAARRFDEMLRKASVEGDSFERLENGRVGLLHAADLDIDALLAKAGRLAPKGGLKRASLAMEEEGLSEAERLRALAYCVNKFAKGDAKVLQMASLGESLKEMVEETVQRVSGLRGVLSSRAVRITFQPIVALMRRTIMHCEVLARTATGESAFELVTFAEQMGLSEELDILIANLAIDALTEAAAAGQKPSIAINVSGRSLQNEIFVRTLRRLMAPHAELRPKILLEVTETSRIEDLDRVGAVIATLKADGHRVCLDDFGAGEACFNYLRKLPVDYIKIDGSFVKNVVKDATEACFVQAISMMAKQIRAFTVAEMIETEDQASKLLGLGVEFGQGFFFGKAQPSLAEAYGLASQILTRGRLPPR